MVDITDVETAIVNIVGAAIYPNGSSQPSILPGAAQARIMRGWPLPASLDADLAAGNAQITIYTLGGSATPVYQLLESIYTITSPTISMGVSVAGDVITVTGQPSAGEFLTVIADGAHVYSNGGANAAAILSALATAAQADYPGASSTSTTLTIPFGHSMVVRQGGQAVMGRVAHRQSHAIMVCIWAPSDDIRTSAAIAADLALKKNNKLTMVDTSQVILRYLRTMSTDQQEKAAIYRRDLIYDAEFATIETFPGYTITSVDISISKPDNSAIATAIA